MNSVNLITSLCQVGIYSNKIRDLIDKVYIKNSRPVFNLQS
jgi:hypothetical protein